MNDSLFVLYTSAHDFKPSDTAEHNESLKTQLLTDKHTFLNAEARAEVDFNYDGCYYAEDDPADYTRTWKAVRVG